MVENIFSASLPQNISRKSELFFSDGNISVFSRVQRGKTKKICQDATLIASEGSSSMIGLFDGHYSEGARVASELCSALYSLWLERRKTISNIRKAALLLHDGAAKAIYKLKEERRKEFKEEIRVFMDPYSDATPPLGTRLPELKNIGGGSTAVLAFIQPKGKYYAACVGDSSAFKVRSDGTVTRMFAYDRVWIGVGQTMPLTKACITPQNYSSYRNRKVLETDIGGLNEEVPAIGCIEVETENLEKGDILIFASDGIVNNLFVFVNKKGLLCDISGCSDLEEIIAGKRGVLEIGNAIMDTALVRASGNSGEIIELDERRILLPVDDDTSVIVFSF